jgi:chitinase
MVERDGALKRSIVIALMFLLAACAPLANPIPQANTPTSISTPTEEIMNPTPTPLPTSVTPGWRVIGYYPGWSVDAHPPESIAADKLTHLNYAFARIDLATGECMLGDAASDAPTFAGLAKLKQQFPHLRILISIGGWDWSEGFSDAALTPNSRQRFAQSCIDLFLIQYGASFDGIDIDWEYPTGGGMSDHITRPEDTRNFTLLMEEFRRQTDALSSQNGRTYLLTAAIPSIAPQFELRQLSNILDWINLMTYDFHGSWDSTTNFNAPLYSPDDNPSGPDDSVDRAVRWHLAQGVPPGKLCLGVPFYGRAWSGVPATDNGLYQPVTSVLEGNYDYDKLVVSQINQNGFRRYWSEEAQVPWLYNPTAGIFITYDDPQSIALKAAYARQQGLGGVMIWEINADNGELLRAIQ